MNDKNYIVIDKVICITVTDFKLSENYRYIPAEKRWILPDEDERYEVKIGRHWFKIDEKPDLKFDEGVFYTYPEVEIEMMSDNKIIKRFKTVREAEDSANELLRKLTGKYKML